MSADGAQWPWSVLGLEGAAELREVKRAYARRLKKIDRNDPQVFQDLRDAFSHAKMLANDGAGADRRPGMAEIMNGVEVAAVVQPPIIPHDPPLPFDPLAPQDGGGPKADEFEEIDLAPSVEETEQTTHSDERSDLPASFEDVGDAELDAFFDLESWRVEMEYMARLERVLQKRPVPLDRLESLLSLSMASNRMLRDRVERKLFDAVAERTEPGKIYPRDFARTIDAHFAWASDGVRLQRKFGYDGRFAAVIDLHSGKVADWEARAARKKADKGPDYKWWRLAVFSLTWVFFTASQQMGDATDWVVQVIAFAILFYLFELLIGFLLKVATFVLLKTRLDGILIESCANVAPSLTDRLRRSPSARRLARTVIAAVALIAVGLSDGL